MFSSLCTLAFLAAVVWVALSLGSQHPDKVDRFNKASKREACKKLDQTTRTIQRIRSKHKQKE